jgi:hypothetical protein
MSASSRPIRDFLRHDSIISTENNLEFSAADYFIQEFFEIKALSYLFVGFWGLLGEFPILLGSEPKQNESNRFIISLVNKALST